MDLELAGRCAVVTGASRGIGLAIALELAREGASVALVARDAAALEDVARGLSGAGGRVIAVPADTTDDRSVSSMATEVRRGLGPVSILVNAAARPSDGRPTSALDPTADATMAAEIQTKVLGYLRCIRAFAPDMATAGWGRIVNISGLAARRTGSLTGSVRNVAVAAMTKNLADELGPHGVNVTVVHPGMTVTERLPSLLAATAAETGRTEEEVLTALAGQTSIRRLVTAQEVARVVAFLCSPASVAITGDAIATGGGELGRITY
jgi:NAD(P)-dependent dehydrogenase (short-subunit alcohol dehydrogenase family)